MGRANEIRVDRIVRIDKPDSLKNGALIGLGVGLSLGISAAAMQPRGSEAKWVFASLLSNGVACTLLGTGVDALVDSSTDACTSEADDCRRASRPSSDPAFGARWFRSDGDPRGQAVNRE